MSTTLLDLREGVRRETRDPLGILYQDPDVDGNINEAYRNAFQQVANAIQGYFIIPIPQDIVGLQREYALPVDCLRLERVEVVIGSTTIPLRKYKRGYAPNYLGGVNFGVRTPVPTYDLEGDNLVLEPTPRVDVPDGMIWTYEITPIKLVDPTDTIAANFKDLWIDVIVLRAARACFSQTEASGGIVSIKEFLKRLEDAETQMENSLSLRTLSPVKKRTRSYFQ